LVQLRIAEIAKRIDEFANSAYEVQAETEAAMAQGFAQQMGDIGTILIAVLSAVFFTILLVAGNTMSQAVRERVSKLGTLKAIGFPMQGCCGWSWVSPCSPPLSAASSAWVWLGR